MANSSHPEILHQAPVAALNGVRALLFIAIFIYHQDITENQKLCYAVDIFFILSGFLIFTSIKKINPLNFFQKTSIFFTKRIFRILFLYLFIIFFFYWYGYLPYLKPFLTFTYNQFLFERSLNPSNSVFELDWSAAGSHLWSLSLEMQFYALVLVFLAFGKKISLKYCALATFLVGLVAKGYYISTEHEGLYGLNFLVSLEFFGIGAVMATFIDEIKKATNTHLRKIIIIISLALFSLLSPEDISGVMLHFRPGWADSLIAIAGAFLVSDLWLNERSIISKCLSFRPLVFLGEMSYGLYLWHLFTFNLFDQWKAALPFSVSTFWGRYLFTFTLSYFTWFLIEKPSMKLGTFITKKIN
jgi:peptidoglycan/LPS O-acetylase OafA/YrhL